MKTIDRQNDQAAMGADAPVSVPDSYAAVRFNAMKHGILSRLTVLAHENAGEFSDLLAALIDEHRPAGMTEQHLVEELAAVIWRKRRVLLAEGAAINRGLKSVATAEKFSNPAPAAAPFERGLLVGAPELAEMMRATPEEIAERQQAAEQDLAATRKAAAILRTGGTRAYKRALGALLPDSRECWLDTVSDEEQPATADGLARFIRETLEPICISVYKEAHFTPAIKSQTLGEGLQVHRLEKLNRYETHLDRKFERTLAMLLKMKELRRP